VSRMAPTSGLKFFSPRDADGLTRGILPAYTAGNASGGKSAVACSSVSRWGCSTSAAGGPASSGLSAGSISQVVFPARDGVTRGSDHCHGKTQAESLMGRTRPSSSPC